MVGVNGDLDTIINLLPECKNKWESSKEEYNTSQNVWRTSCTRVSYYDRTNKIYRVSFASVDKNAPFYALSKVINPNVQVTLNVKSQLDSTPCIITLTSLKPEVDLLCNSLNVKARLDKTVSQSILSNYLYFEGKPKDGNNSLIQWFGSGSKSGEPQKGKLGEVQFLENFEHLTIGWDNANYPGAKDLVVSTPSFSNQELQQFVDKYDDGDTFQAILKEFESTVNLTFKFVEKETQISSSKSIGHGHDKSSVTNMSHENKFSIIFYFIFSILFTLCCHR